MALYTPEESDRLATYWRFIQDQIASARDEARHEMNSALAFAPAAMRAAKKWSKPDYPHLGQADAVARGFFVHWALTVYEDIARHLVDVCPHMVVPDSQHHYPIRPGLVLGHIPRRLWCLDCGCEEMVRHAAREVTEVCVLCDQPADTTLPASALALYFWIYAYLCPSCWEASNP